MAAFDAAKTREAEENRRKAGAALVEVITNTDADKKEDGLKTSACVAEFTTAASLSAPTSEEPPAHDTLLLDLSDDANVVVEAVAGDSDGSLLAVKVSVLGMPITLTGNGVVMQGRVVAVNHAGSGRFIFVVDKNVALAE